MILSWTPVIALDVIGSLITLAIALVCAFLARDLTRKDNEDIFHDYIYLLTLAFVFFAVSRSFGHLVKQFLLYHSQDRIWQNISPYSGAVNTAAFIIIFALGCYFQRFQRIYLELRGYKDNLENLVTERTRELERENRERKSAQKELHRALVTLKTIFNSASPICITDREFNLVEANDAYRRIWPDSDTLEEPLKCYGSRPGSLCHTPMCPLEQIFQGREEVVSETVRKIGDQQPDRIFLQTSRPFRDAEGELIGTVTTFHDITERRKARDELAAERERLEVTLFSIGDGVITTDTAGRVVMLNRAAEQLCGFSQQEAAGRPLEEIFRTVSGTNGNPLENPVTKVLETGNIIAQTDPVVLTARDGTRLSIGNSGAPIRDAQGKIIGVVLVFRDITDRLRLEKELVKSQKLESVGLMAGGIAHDFNNILAAILGNIDLAIYRLDKNNRVLPLLMDAEKASLRAKGLTQQLLTFARGGSPVRRTVSIAGIIRDSSVFILRGSKVGFDLDIDENLRLVDIDPGQMSQVIQNIILNAREAMPEGGKVRVSCRNSLRTLEGKSGPQEVVEIAIADTGPGISPEILDKLFDPYFTTKKRGTGLGLSICHSIISQHGGTITVDSAPGAGTTFTIYLPASSGRGQFEEPEPETVRSSVDGLRVLIMDDEEIVCKIARAMLEQLGHRADVVHSGEEALDLYRKALAEGRGYDLVIMDLTIPGGMGGKKTLGLLRKIDPTVRAIVASGYSNDSVMANHETYGFKAAIVKPFRLQDLTAAMEKALAD